jgi:hypothetical protein
MLVRYHELVTGSMASVVDETQQVEIVPGRYRRVRNVGDDVVLAVAAFPHGKALSVDRAGADRGADRLDGAVWLNQMS